MVINESVLLEKLKNWKAAIESRNNEIAHLNQVLAQKEEEILKLKSGAPQVPIPQRQEVFSDEKIASHPKNFVFARSTKETADKFEKFIRKCVSHEAGKAFIVMPETAAIYADISVKTKDNFMRILQNMSLDNKKLVIKSDGRYFANFAADEICAYLLKEI